MVACAPVKPANPIYNWASGKWVGETIRGKIAEAKLQVINGNQLEGYFTYQSTSGSINDGKITSGHVLKKDGFDLMKGEVYWDFGRPSSFLLTYEDKTLVGYISSFGQLPWGDGSRNIILKKAK